MSNEAIIMLVAWIVILGVFLYALPWVIVVGERFGIWVHNRVVEINDRRWTKHHSPESWSWPLRRDVTVVFWLDPQPPMKPDTIMVRVKIEGNPIKYDFVGALARPGQMLDASEIPENALPKR